MINPRFLLSFALFFVSTSSHANLIFSEYVEGSSYNKALEIFNSGTVVNFDSGDYSIEIYSNGASEASYTVNLSGVLQQNSTYVIGHSSADLGITAVADQLSGSLNFNGDDAVALIYNGLIIDSIGQIGVDPGSAWGSGALSTQNHTLSRQSSIVEGDANPSDVFDPGLQWLGFDVDVFSNLGHHEYDFPLQLLSEQSDAQVVSAPEPASFILLLLALLPILLKWSNINQYMPFLREKLC